ncbi:MAG: SDR family oxidoreductase [Candidatus Syntropharchaeales archaeon]
MKFIVTGGAGFIGSNLSEVLAENGEVLIIDDLSSGKFENIRDLIEKDNVKFIEGNITDLKLLKANFNGVDCIFHHAAIVSVQRSVEDPVATDEVNIRGTLNVLIAARDCGVKKVICASSSAVYGDSPELPNREDMKPSPLSPYAVSKLTGEYYCKVFSEIYGIKTVCLRYFNVYGPRQDPSSEYAAVIPKFITMAIENKPPLIFGNGEQTRDFVFVKDVVRANILAMEQDIEGVFNVAGGRGITINELLNTIVDVVGVKLNTLYSEPRAGDIKDSVADISLARRELGYEPAFDLKEGLRLTREWLTNAR